MHYNKKNVARGVHVQRLILFFSILAFQKIYSPPSWANTCPVTKDKQSKAKNRTPSATLINIGPMAKWNFFLIKGSIFARPLICL